MALDLKRYETRGRQTHHRGPLVIHAAKCWMDYQQNFAFEMPAEHWVAFKYAGIMSMPTDLPMGALVAVVDVVDCVRVESLTLPPAPDRPHYGLSDEERFWGNYSPGRWAWITTNVRRFKTPIPWRGYQYLFDVPDEIIQQALAA
jgi:hypothetical protein